MSLQGFEPDAQTLTLPNVGESLILVRTYATTNFLGAVELPMTFMASLV